MMLEQLAIFRLPDRFRIRTDQDVIACAVVPFSCSSSAASSAVCPPSVGSTPISGFRDDLLDDINRDRLNISAIGHVGIGHDRGRIGIDQDH